MIKNGWGELILVSGSLLLTTSIQRWSTFKRMRRYATRVGILQNMENTPINMKLSLSRLIFAKTKKIRSQINFLYRIERVDKPSHANVPFKLFNKVLLYRKLSWLKNVFFYVHFSHEYKVFSSSNWFSERITLFFSANVTRKQRSYKWTITNFSAVVSHVTTHW